MVDIWRETFLGVPQVDWKLMTGEGGLINPDGKSVKQGSTCGYINLLNVARRANVNKNIASPRVPHPSRL